VGEPDTDLPWDIGGDGAMGSISVTVDDTDGDASLPSSVTLSAPGLDGDTSLTAEVKEDFSETQP
jgi:hypothetical protein